MIKDIIAESEGEKIPRYTSCFPNIVHQRNIHKKKIPVALSLGCQSLSFYPLFVSRPLLVENVRPTPVKENAAKVKVKQGVFDL